MKKVFGTILMLAYLYCTAGATIYQHYCMGELVSSSLIDSNDRSCGKCGMEKHTEANKDCCKDVSIVVKADLFHTFSQTVYDFHAFIFILPVIPFITVDLNIPESQTVSLSRAHGPPLLKLPLFIQFSNFKI